MSGVGLSGTLYPACSQFWYCIAPTKEKYNLLVLKNHYSPPVWSNNQKTGTYASLNLRLHVNRTFLTFEVDKCFRLVTTVHHKPKSAWWVLLLVKWPHWVKLSLRTFFQMFCSPFGEEMLMLSNIHVKSLLSLTQKKHFKNSKSYSSARFMLISHEANKTLSV